ncbi:hypothetical protein DAI22_03g247300 [Oryza sativa Japonica Group]|uniref:Expressed protein n=5 Tax=Oryza TaxID=4527 RepID=Q10H95_ORYSJ|nr:expressed protein [Oryza sativa Japonica Group]KAF2940116.1 hypothetical protein DAI22_03g247300 [Oryza sativa Japonica Group]
MMDHHHTMQIQFHDLKHCNPGSDARITRSSGVSQVAFVLAAIALISLVSPSSVEYTVFSSTLPAPLRALGSFVMSKKALFVLSNAIFLFLAADYYRCFFSLSPSTSDFTACGHTGVGDKQEQHHHQVGVEPSSATESCVPDHSEAPYRDNDDASEDCSHGERMDGEGSRRNIVRTPDDEMPSGEQKAHGDIAMPSQPEFFRLDEDDVILESAVVKEPSCGTTGQELDKLGIDELNKKFEEFIKSRRTKWEKEEASLS